MKPSRVAQALFAAILLVIAVALSAGAGHEDGVATDYTGCVNLNRGVVKFLQAGPTPLEPCPSGWAAIHLSAGDLTQIVSSDGNINVVNGGNGSVTLDLSPLGIADGSVNEPGDPVHWTKLKGIPAGFADGSDAIGGIGGVQAFTTSADFTVPDGVTHLLIDVWGGGGGGGGGHETFTGTLICRGGGGGGAGGFARAAVQVVPGETYEVTVGTGGAGGPGGSEGLPAGAGTAGGDTGFGPPGAPLTFASGGSGGAGASTSGPGPGGAGGLGDPQAGVLISGGSGVAGSTTSTQSSSCPTRPSGSGLGGVPAPGTRPGTASTGGAGGFGRSSGAAGGPGFVIIQW